MRLHKNDKPESQANGETAAKKNIYSMETGETKRAKTRQELSQVQEWKKDGLHKKPAKKNWHT